MNYPHPYGQSFQKKKVKSKVYIFLDNILNLDANMKRLEEIEQILKQHKGELQKKFKVKKIGIFGSYVRGEARETSDVDILVDFYEVPSLLTFLKLEEYLEELLGIRVDLVMESALKPKISQAVHKEVVYI